MTTEQTIKVTVPDQLPTSAPSAGFKSTEFISMAATAAAMAMNVVPEKYAPLMVGLVGVYVACRSLLKAAHVLGYAKQVPDLPDVPPIVQPTEKVTS